jgi:hypothetical protein
LLDDPVRALVDVDDFFTRDLTGKGRHIGLELRECTELEQRARKKVGPGYDDYRRTQ